MITVRRSPAARRRGLLLLPVALAASGLVMAACSSSSSGGSSPAASASGAASTPASSTPSASVAGSSSGASASSSASGDLTVWVDAARLPAAKAYAAAHPDVNLKIVTYDGDGNGATSLQAKILLWNRTNSGWPDVIFSEQVNDPIWMAQKPFNFAEPVTDHLSADMLKQWPATSTAQCTVDGKQVCVQDNLAPVVLWVNKKLMDKFGYTTPKTWQEWAALGQKVASEHPGYIVGNIGDSYSHWIYLWANQCPLQHLQGSQLLINATDSHCTEMASLLDPLIKNGTVPPLSVFTPDFAKKYGGADDKVVMMPGPAWYAQSLFDQTLHVPAGQITSSAPLQWNSDSPVTTGQVGGGPWIMSNHSKNFPAASDFVTWVTTVFNPSGKLARPGLPGYAPLAETWLAAQATNPYFAADPTPALKASADQIWQGWSLVTYPDQPVWSNKVVTALVAGKSLSSQLQPFGDALSQVAKAAGYSVTNK
jgi:ABC-type glycerol-3-phosphate transport system substrate-binding protein